MPIIATLQRQGTPQDDHNAAHSHHEGYVVMWNHWAHWVQ